MEVTQAALWNGVAGRAWVEEQALLDLVFAPFEAMLVEAVAGLSVQRVLDVGCGTGATTLAIARLLGTGGSCTGIDLSEPMIEAARARAARAASQASFVVADAQTHAFAPGAFDAIVSRFGVMFFDDPVAAFTNLRRAATADAPLRFVAWRSPAENPFMTTAERAAAPLVPELPSRRTDGPGQFGFADERRVRRILEASGWGEVRIDPIDVACGFAASDLPRYMMRLGPLGTLLGQLEATRRAEVLDAVAAAFKPYVEADRVRFTAACWAVGARAGAG